ncbi:DUF1622 domain-containing protein [uncultured Methanofollis sp.]|uniref:DUF1622 domain-containing protein n=1 Tax=uncultured Methanofollis sp. TaxID=262500 RepID=UPI002612A6B9|nr:DUF1622 domain-containing protein [uncultured Methanofollis sp.]
MLLEVYAAAAAVFSLIGAVIIIYGGVGAAVGTLRKEVLGRPLRYGEIRREFTIRIVFGLDFLIAADILLTLVTPSQEEILFLGSIVIIRTILGYFLTKEATEFNLD